ncbi:MAG: hypothetical protein ACR2H3_00935, partial [Acidimicrobiales bacterium]
SEAGEDQRECKALPLMIFGGLVFALAVLFFATQGGDETPVAAPATTQVQVTEPATSAPTTDAPATTAAPTTKAPSTTVAPVPNYSFVPKTCEQNGQQITYTGDMTNKADRAYSFVVRVVFKDSGGATVAESTARIDKLASGQKTTMSTTGTSNKSLAGSGASCDVEKIDATPA